MDECCPHGRVPLPDRIALSPEEASAITGIGLTRIREATISGVLKAYKHGRRTIIIREDLVAWIRAMPKAAGENVPFKTESRVASGVGEGWSALADSTATSQAVETQDSKAGKRSRRDTSLLGNAKAGRGNARMQMQKQTPVKKR